MMKLSQLLQNVRVRESNADMEMEISGVSYDSRKTQAGDLFVAMTGYETDGHKFIPMAREKGAACVLCQEKPQGDDPYVLVEDSRLALAQVGKGWVKPLHALAMAAPPGSLERVQAVDREQALTFLKGETLVTAQEGWTLVTWQDLPLGWGKQAEATLKNHVPKGLRARLHP